MKSKEEAAEILDSTIDLINSIRPMIKDVDTKIQLMALGSLVSSLLLSSFSTEKEALEAYNFFLESVGVTVEAVSEAGLSSWQTGTAH